MKAKVIANGMCPRCGSATPLPYLCRGCWAALGQGGQVAFYHRLTNGGLEVAMLKVEAFRP